MLKKDTCPDTLLPTFMAGAEKLQGTDWADKSRHTIRFLFLKNMFVQNSINVSMSSEKLS